MLSEYLAGNEQVTSWFGGPWSSIEGLEHWPAQKQHWPREALNRILAEHADAYQASPLTKQHIKLLKQSDAYAIICGQQPALGGGPLYSIIKAAQAIVTAERLRQLSMKVVPIFWCASEDHDEGECNHADLMTRNGQIHRLSVGFDKPGASLHFQLAETWWPQLIEQLTQLFGKSLGSAWFAKLKPLPQESTSAWTCRLLSHVFSDHGLICIEAHHLRPLWYAQVTNLVDHWPSLALANRRKEILDAGFADSFNGHLSAPPLFLDTPTGRSAIPNLDAKKKQNWEKNLNVSENNISSGAALRPIVQQMCLPGLAFIGGPGELSYHAFLGPAYHEFKVPLPRFIPRQNVTLIPTWLKRQIEAWGLKPQDITLDSTAPSLLTQAELNTDEQEQQIRNALQNIGQEIQNLRQLNIRNADLKRRNQGAVRSLETAHNRMQQSLERRQRSKQRLPPFGQIKDFLFPRRSPHERSMSCSQAIWLYGPGIGNALVKELTQAKPGQAHFLHL